MSAREIRIPQEPIMRPTVQTTTEQLTPEYLDSIINNPNEHPQVKKQAEQMKRSLFPQSVVSQEVEPPKKSVASKTIPQAAKEISEEDFMVEPATPQLVRKRSVPVAAIEEAVEAPINQPVQIPSTIKATKQSSPAVPAIQIKPVNSEEFDSFLSDFKNNLFNDEFTLPSSPETKIQLRSMTVSEYKFLSKQFEVYQRSLGTIDKANLEAAREIDIRESILTNAIDNILQRCITNNIRVYDLTLFDWVYAMLALRAISRGTETNLKTRCTNKDCGQDIRVGVLDLMKKIESQKSKFIINPVGIVPVKEGINLYLGLPTRGDLVEGQKIFLGDPDSSLGFVNISMYIRAYVNNQNTANLLEPQQRFALMNALQYDIIKNVREVVNQNFENFYKCFSEFKCPACSKSVEVDVSDFILFFYDF